MKQIPHVDFARVMHLIANIDVGNTHRCWPWLGHTTDDGYGEINIDGSQYGVHRVIAALYFGPHEEWVEVVMHKCDNPPCCNPAHLLYATQQQNIQDAQEKGHKIPKCGESNGNSKLTSEDVIAIRQSDETQKILAERYHVSQPSISRIQSKKDWIHV